MIKINSGNIQQLWYMCKLTGRGALLGSDDGAVFTLENVVDDLSEKSRATAPSGTMVILEKYNSIQTDYFDLGEFGVYNLINYQDFDLENI